MENAKQIKKANEHALAALERMQKEQLLPTPKNYELWFVYYAAINPEVCRAIEALDASGEAITTEICDELYERFIGHNKESEQVKEAGNKIQETIKNVNSMVSSVQEASTQYSEALSDASGKLSTGEIDKEQLEQVVQTVMSSTKYMIDQNVALEETLAQSSAAVQELQRDLEIARQEALTDGLTNLANRKAFDLEIVRIKALSEEEGQPFSLLLLDIDYFKSFNDNFGHQVGDQVLRLVAHTLTDGVKGRDVAARYGGEEFAIILPETPLKAAQMVADYLRKAVASKDIVNRNSGEKLGRITLSGGCAEYAPGESVDALIGRVDTALYAAKHNGRNQISSAPPPSQKKAAG